ncbi:hypothetical protein [Thalassococcus sp. BH17M4-6]|uniref:hypothetical protein n=1 Tax=Thalassococcus sp. BH17M4-6 TaxID=3413148 RepID=UPI003BF49044
MRPSSFARFVQVIAARFDAFGAGTLAVLAMALGTTATTLTVAVGGRLARLLIGIGQSSNPEFSPGIWWIGSRMNRSGSEVRIWQM